MAFLLLLAPFVALAWQDVPLPEVSESIKQLIENDGSQSYPPEYKFFFENKQKFSPEGYQDLLHLLNRLEEGGFRAQYDFRSLFGLMTLAQNKKAYTHEKLHQLTKVLATLFDGDRRSFEKEITDLYKLLDKGILTSGRSVTVILANADYDIMFNEPPEFTEAVAQEYVAPAEAEQNLGTQNPADRKLPQMLEELGAVVHLKKGDILFANYADTFRLKHTEGYYLLSDNRFTGQDGLVDWQNRGIDAAERSARINTYTFAEGDGSFTFSDSYLIDNKRLTEPAIGELLIRMSNSKYELESYPEFISYYASNKLIGFGNENMTFIGGAHLKGNDYQTDSKFDEPSTVTYQENGVKMFRVKSSNFVFDDRSGQLMADKADITIYHGGDSIFNPIVDFTFDMNKGQLFAEAKVKGYEYSPFRSSYFNVEMVGDRIEWDLSKETLDVTIVAAKREVPLIVESKDFYSDERYNELSQIFGFHPLTLAMQMVDEQNNEFYIADLTTKFNYNKSVVETTMKYLMAYGYVYFEEAIGRVTVLEKARHAYNAHLQQERNLGFDYDDLLIPSIVGRGPNATVDFLDSSMTVRGVNEFLVSDSLDVVITPTNGEIKILKNRDIEFYGSLNAGNFTFNGAQFKFEYDSFLVRLIQIDSIELSVDLSLGERQNLSNKLINSAGVLRINDPNNKSALKSNPQYPIFESSESAYVDFDQEAVLKGAYDSTIYFDIPPFTLDSVADADPTKYAFKGTLHSSGILPEFEEDLKVMPDNSFGFIHQIPDSGYHMYQTDARVFGELRLDNQGITSPGLIEHLTGTFEVERATFFVDSLVAEKGIVADLKGASFDSVPFPEMRIEEYSLHYLARSDSMILANLNNSKPFSLFADKADLRGQMVLQTTGLIGSGEMNLGASNLKSDSISFKTESFNARHTNFTLNAANSSKPILSSDDVMINYDLAAQIADIQPEVAGRAALEFPYAQFRTSIPTAQWNIEDNVIVMSKPEEIPLDESFFYTTNKALDSLAFNATAATYDIEKKELTVKGIPSILVADALITPQGDSLTILENSRIGTIYNAEILMDAVNKYHRMFDAEIEILSSSKFRGRATYELVNALQDTFAIQLDEFQYMGQTEIQPAHTKASGQVTADMGIRISSGFIYEGRVTMYAYKEALELNGAVKLDMKELNERNIWIEYASSNDVNEIIIPFDQALTRQGQPLNAGIHFDSRGDIYMSFITEKRDYMDFDFFAPKGGNLYFNPSNNSYNIDNPLKVENPSQYFEGSMFSYNETSKEVSFEGKLDFFGGARGNNIQAAGKGRGNLDSANFEVSAMMTLAFGLTAEGLGAMGQNLSEMGETLGVARALDDRSELIYRAAEFIGDDATRAWDKSYQTVPIPLFAASPEMLRDIVISNVDLKWSKQNRAFYSEGKIGISNVSNIDLNMELDGFMEIRKTAEGDILTLLLEMTDGTWYYFNYDGFTLAQFSSNDAFNAQIMSTNLGSNKVGAFNPFTASQAEVIQWVTDFRKLYYGIDEPYRLLMASDSNQRLKKKNTVEGDGF